MAERTTRITDRRVQKTRDLLHSALESLVQEKPYDAITVTEILGRANVGRSTFYTHFEDKDELLASRIQDILRSASPPPLQTSAAWQEAIVAFSLPIFEHIHGHRATVPAAMGMRGRAILHEHLENALVDAAADRIRKALTGHHKQTTPVPAELLAQSIVSTFIVVLHWWLDSRTPLSPKEVDAVFRRLVLPTLAACA